MSYRTLQLRRNTAAGAVSSNPTLAAGEPGYETDTGRMKIGDGSTEWTSLPYFSPSPYDIIGVREDLNATTPTMAFVNQWLDVIPTPNTSYFENHPTFAGIYRCNVADDGTVNAVYGDPSFAYDGSNGQVMSRIPKFWYKEEITSDYRYRWISPYAVEGFTESMGFYKDDTSPRRIVDEIFIGTFNACAYDVSESAYITDDTAVDFTAITGDKLSSVAGVKPLSGNIANATQDNCRIAAENRGDGWQLLDGEQLAAIQTLLIIRYGTRNLQSVYRGVCDEASGSGNESHNTGFSAGYYPEDGGHDAGNEEWENSSKATGSREFSALTIENLYGNIWQWIDGVNIRGSPNWGEVWTCNHSFESNKFTSPYTNYGTVANTNAAWQYIKTMLPGQLMVPNAHQASSVQYYCDGLYTRASSDPTHRVVLFGGNWYLADPVGAFCLNLYHASSGRDRTVGARIAFVKPSA